MGGGVPELACLIIGFWLLLDEHPVVGLIMILIGFGVIK